MAKIIQKMTLGLAFPVLANLSGCLKAPGPGLELVNGCYYANDVPVIRISGGTGSLKIPGEVSRVQVSSSKDQNTSAAVFSPAFLIVSGQELRTVRMPKLSKAHYMMDPYSSVPTVLVPTESKQLVKLSLGANC